MCVWGGGGMLAVVKVRKKGRERATHCACALTRSTHSVQVALRSVAAKRCTRVGGG